MQQNTENSNQTVHNKHSYTKFIKQSPFRSNYSWKKLIISNTIQKNFIVRNKCIKSKFVFWVTWILYYKGTTEQFNTTKVREYADEKEYNTVKHKQ